jgi:hypothetical protein
MAEIPIERKQGRNWLPLLLLALLALALLAYCFQRSRTPDPVAGAAGAADSLTRVDTAAPSAAGAAAAGGANGAIDQFVQFVQQRDTTNETEGQHQYTAEGTRRLAAALDAIAAGNPDIAVYADSMRSSIERLQRSSDTDVHADDAKAAFSAAVSAMEQIDRARGRTRDVQALRATFNDLSGRQPLMPQLPTVHRFFQAAADALQQMRG